MAYYDHITMLRLGLGRWRAGASCAGGAKDQRRSEAIRRARAEQDQRDAELESHLSDD